uniref:Histidine rich glycoprotein n=1 Tax=Myotis myotis TaxID=51298 RepID=A0A7J7ZWY5_MYOMY|nr:histidine rich glycoprotein [Myotis myotis]
MPTSSGRQKSLRQTTTSRRSSFLTAPFKMSSSFLAPMAHMHPLIIIVPMSTIPMDSVLMSIILMDIISIDIIPMDTIPMDTISMDNIPMAMVLMTMDPVTHHPIGKVPKITITGAMAHHLGTQKKKVQAKDTPLKWRQIGYVYRLPPLKKGEVLPLPEANFPSFSLPNHNYPLKPKIQPFPQSASELCPGMFNSEFSQVSKFFEETFPKRNLSSLKNE